MGICCYCHSCRSGFKFFKQLLAVVNRYKMKLHLSYFVFYLFLKLILVIYKYLSFGEYESKVYIQI